MTDKPASMELAEEMIRFGKALHRVKATLMHEVPDRAAYGLLLPLRDADRRASDLADLTHSDPSTISRHISHLIGSGLVQRVPDQHDGRAALLSLTDDGRALCEELRSQRALVIGRLLQHWPEPKMRQFIDLLHEFNDDLAAQHDQLVDGFRSAYETAIPAPATTGDTTTDAPERPQGAHA